MVGAVHLILLWRIKVSSFSESPRVPRGHKMPSVSLPPRFEYF